jgi:hypothetical protein
VPASLSAPDVPTSISALDAPTTPSAPDVSPEIYHLNSDLINSVSLDRYVSYIGTYKPIVN